MIPVHTTTITIRRLQVAEDADPAEADWSAATEVATGVRAVISSPTGRERNIGGQQAIVEHSLSCDPVDLDHKDRVEDEATGTTYEVAWVAQRPAPAETGIDHTRAGLRVVSGLSR